ncbi:tyrosine--tRNA ligase TYS1 [Aspergillus clavatus NRRL 1]|uniref:Tyrosine--tRNA ligase n=1 Tax=Aspergillus clavatus (strain ATCC 1007 / CBS 513.65 / DSM 816 / NCTC 3887 / NRRL 1 / QM 1276 / 107) TaxID=344612 RepID=A1CB11_ASPCL|nr:tyrosyl-tRNA synthetase [Aspergillus clavatus NRRL 1]EAW12929.1 tyrosyl-tRNA synthetase [Aspergillus clavatus NRRL 1]
MASMDAGERLSLIKENLQEVLNQDLIEGILAEGRNPRIYWGTSPTGKPHCGYFVPAVKIAQLLAAGCDVTILIADIHGFLDNLKAPIELVEHRAKYYEYTITAMLQAVGVSTEKLRFVLGSSYQKSPDYVMDVYRLCSLVSEHDAKKAGAEVVKQTDNSPLSGLLYPILQVLDEQYLDCDIQFGGIDQRKLFAASTEWQPKLGYRKRAHLMNPMVPGLTGGKMSSSEEDSKIDLLEAADTVRKKIRKAQAAPQDVNNNGVLSFAQYVLLPASALKTGRPEFRVNRERDGLEPLVYTNIEQMQEDYKTDVLTPQLLKPAVADALAELMAPIRAAYEASAEWQEITLKAYPPPAPKKKEKKQKDKGSRYPGAKPQQNDESAPAAVEA